MSRETSPFLNLPLELRIHIYHHALIQHQPDIPLTAKKSRIKLRGEKDAYKEKPIAFLITTTSSADLSRWQLACPLALSQANRQIRSEFSDLLRTASVDIICNIRSFDFSHVIEMLATVPMWRQDQFLVREDGTAESTLYLRLGGPYAADWRADLMQWIAFVDSLTINPTGELRTSHRTTRDVFDWDRNVGDWNRDYCATYGRIVSEIYLMYQRHRRGGGRLEFDKIFYTLLCRYNAEVMMRGGHPTFERLLLAQH